MLLEIPNVQNHFDAVTVSSKIFLKKLSIFSKDLDDSFLILLKNVFENGFFP